MPASIAATSSGSSGRRQSMPATSPAKTGVSGRIDIGMSARPLPCPPSTQTCRNTRCHPGEGRDPSINRSLCGSVDPGLRRDDDLMLVGILAEVLTRLLRSPAIAERVFAQKIEIAAAVGLQNLAAVEPGIAALGHRRRRRLAARQLVGRDQKVDPALLDREPKAVAVL